MERTIENSISRNHYSQYTFWDFVIRICCRMHSGRIASGRQSEHVLTSRMNTIILTLSVWSTAIYTPFIHGNILFAGVLAVCVDQLLRHLHSLEIGTFANKSLGDLSGIQNFLVAGHGRKKCTALRCCTSTIYIWLLTTNCRHHDTVVAGLQFE